MARLVSIFICIMLIWGCIPYSDNPITEPDEEKIDTAIFGSWFWNDAQDSGYIHIGRDEDTRMMRLVMSEFDKHGQLKVSEFLGHTSTLAGKTYMNLKWVRPAGDQPGGFLLVKYAMRPDALGLAVMSPGAVEEAIKSSALEGKLKKGNLTSEIRITAVSRQLQRFIQLNDQKLFPEMVYLQRVKLPDLSSKQMP